MARMGALSVWKVDVFTSQLNSGTDTVVKEWPIVFMPPEKAV